MPIGQNIKNILKEQNMSQYRLAKKSKVSQSYINELINGKYKSPSVLCLNNIAIALGVPITKLLE